MIANARAIESQVRTSLAAHPMVVSVRGKGCLLGIEFDGPSKPFHARLLDDKIITGTSSEPNVLRLLPPLCVTASEIDLLTEALRP
jgi:acetylornithine/N-succinyldiaminopimelate aminotransferase